MINDGGSIMEKKEQNALSFYLQMAWMGSCLALGFGLCLRMPSYSGPSGIVCLCVGFVSLATGALSRTFLVCSGVASFLLGFATPVFVLFFMEWYY